MHELAVTEKQVASDWFADEAAAAAAAASGSSSASGGAMSMVERSAPEGYMPPLVSRDEQETYRVLAGEVVFFVGSDMVSAGPGDVVVAPAGTARTFRAGSGGARWLVLTRVRSLDRFADFGRAVSPPLADPSTGWPSGAERAAIESMAVANGIKLLGPPGALPASC
jgi:mannose-6-phosphate isomerase-like protein (cupin superfamily)